METSHLSAEVQPAPALNALCGLGRISAKVSLGSRMNYIEKNTISKSHDRWMHC